MPNLGINLLTFDLDCLYYYILRPGNPSENPRCIAVTISRLSQNHLDRISIGQTKHYLKLFVYTAFTIVLRNFQTFDVVVDLFKSSLINSND